MMGDIGFIMSSWHGTGSACADSAGSTPISCPMGVKGWESSKSILYRSRLHRSDAIGA